MIATPGDSLMTATEFRSFGNRFVGDLCDACLAVPLSVAIVPMASTYWFADEHSFSTVVPSFAHQRWQSALGAGVIEPSGDRGGSAGLGLLVVVHCWATIDYELGEKGLTLLGAGFVVLAHVHNFRLCAKANVLTSCSIHWPSKLAVIPKPCLQRRPLRHFAAVQQGRLYPSLV